MIGPQGTVWLGHVPWDSTYRHVYYEGMEDKNLILSSFMTLETQNYTYLRQDEDIRVPYNADSLYGINYCMYRNEGMWFCAFVNSITFISNNTALLHLQEDVWHTWGGALTWKACMVAREHVSTDELGQWRAPEPALELESVTLTTQEFNSLSYNSIVVGVNAIPHLKDDSGSIFEEHDEEDFDGSDAVAGGYYNSIYSGAAYYGFEYSEVDALSAFLDNLNKAGAAESICCMFMVPSTLMETDSDHRVTTYASGGVDSGFSAPQYHSNGYVPHNKKCLTYPYAYATITDYTGGEMDVKYEDCNTWGEVQYKFQQGLDPTAQIFCTMRNYMAQSIDFSHAMPVAQNPQCAWTYSAYQNWAAQNAQVLDVKRGSNVLTAIGGIGAVIASAFLFSSGVGIAGAGPLGLTGAQMTAAGLGLSGLGTVIGAEVANQGIDAEIDAQSKVPNFTKGGSSSNSLQGIARNEGGYVCHGLQRGSAERLDAFFDVLGYAVDLVKVPNVTGRPAWNYVKTVGANMTGNIPADRLAAMNTSLDKGVTFWHNADVGNYGLSNALGG